MKKGQQLFPGIVLIGFGLFFFLDGTPIQKFLPLFIWPTMLAILGIAFLIQGYGAKEYESIIPGVLFLGLGIHFYISQRYQVQFDHIGVIILMLALGFFLRHQKTKSGLFYGWLFFILAIFRLFYGEFVVWLGRLGKSLEQLDSFWPILLIASGVFVFLFKRK